MAAVSIHAPAGQKLRVALLVDSALQPRWVAEAFAALAGCGFAEVSALVESPVPPAAEGILWKAYSRLDRGAFGVRPDPMEKTDLRPLFPGAASQLDANAVDVVFELGAARAATAPHLGAWRFFFGSAADEDAERAGMREILSGATVMPCGIKARLPEGGRERIVYQSWSRVFDYSLARTRDNQLPKASAFPARALKNLCEGGEAWLRACLAVAIPPAGAPEPGALPAVLAGRVLKGVQRSLTEVSQWFLAYRFCGPEARWAGDLRDWTCLVPPRDRFWADPFPVERAGRHYVFFEELPFASGRAHISAMELRPDGSRSEPFKVLECPYHLSYPFLFEHAGALFMVPESGDNRTVEVYRCTRFPDQWTLESVLLEGGFFTDATLHRGEDRWWMFVNQSPAGTQGCDELNLYHAADPLGRWEPHRMNPVKSDVRGARPAGALYRAGGALYRPGQIGAPIYGRGVSINRVLRLDAREYRETEVQRVMPTHPREVLGVHTVNRAGALAVMDGFVRRPRFGAWPCSWGYAHGH